MTFANSAIPLQRKMTTRKEATAACLDFGLCYEDYPFHDVNWTVMRHNGTGKTFAFIYEHRGNMCINLKLPPQKCAWLQQNYAQITPGYHMNKRHWVTVILDGTLPDEFIVSLIGESYDLTNK